MSTKNILIVEDETVIRSSLKKFLENNNYKVCEAGSVKEAVKHNLTAFSLIITDLRLPGASGTEMIKLAPGVPVLVMTSYASLRSAVDTMKQGAVDYIAKPFDFDELLAIIKELMTGKEGDDADVEMLGKCKPIAALSKQLEKVAPTDTNVLIEGESGTGKELVAKKIHLLSGRSERQMISLNCAAIPDTIIESELFGHEKGAFTGASTARVGLVEAADGSTLFLDEIGELPLDAQARLLRVLQESEVRRIGSVETRKVSVRLIASTHRNLQALVTDGSFREDLYYRLNVVRLSLPPLRERGDDVILLANHFLQKYSDQHKKNKLRFSDSATHCIKTYKWPGNIRELENAVQRAVILCDSKVIDAELLSVEATSSSVIPEEDSQLDNLSLEDYFQKFVLENQDHMTETELAHKLGISRKSLWQKRQKLNIPREKSRRR